MTGPRLKKALSARGVRMVFTYGKPSLRENFVSICSRQVCWGAGGAPLAHPKHKTIPKRLLDCTAAHLMLFDCAMCGPRTEYGLAITLHGISVHASCPTLPHQRGDLASEPSPYIVNKDIKTTHTTLRSGNKTRAEGSRRGRAQYRGHSAGSPDDSTTSSTTHGGDNSRAAGAAGSPDDSTTSSTTHGGDLARALSTTPQHTQTSEPEPPAAQTNQATAVQSSRSQTLQLPNWTGLRLWMDPQLWTPRLAILTCLARASWCSGASSFEQVLEQSAPEGSSKRLAG